MSQKISEGKVVLFEYVLTNPEGEVLDTSEGREPMPYLHGSNNIVPGLERAMFGKSVGDSFPVVVAPVDAYGEATGQEPVALPRDQFPADAVIAPGMQFRAEAENERVVVLTVVNTDEETIWASEDHPLAGMTLHFTVQIVAIRDATDEEKAHGHPHGPDGHGHH